MRYALWAIRAAMCVTVMLVCGLPGQAAGQEGATMVLSEGEKGAWDIAKAAREGTSTRERVSMKGLWRWQPAAADANAVPADGWGFVQVPGPWPGGTRRGGSEPFYPHPSWQDRPLEIGRAHV
jgi:hypothetical protein